jgi:hypothetical protein
MLIFVILRQSKHGEMTTVCQQEMGGLEKGCKFYVIERSIPPRHGEERFTN